jgi:VCBS repeat-containing protein
VTANFSTNTIKLYINGVLDRTIPNYGFNPTVNNAPVNIGITNNLGVHRRHFNGIIDELQLYNRVLSDAEINAIFTAGSAGLCSNQPPVAVDNAYSVAEDMVLTVPAPGVLGNDTDANGDALTALVLRGPSHGSLSLNADGSFTYTPAANFHGPDTFTYEASNGALASNQAGVTITVSAVNDPPVALADGPLLGVAGSPVHMDASASSDAEGAGLTFRWDVGDGSTLVTTQPTIAHTYASAGTFAVTLKVKVPFTGFHPAPNTSETVPIPLELSTRNTLELQVDGTRADGRKATDRDALTFIVP